MSFVECKRKNGVGHLFPQLPATDSVVENHQVKQLKMDKKQSDVAQRKAQMEHREDISQMRRQLEVTGREMNEQLERELEAREDKLRLKLGQH